MSYKCRFVQLRRFGEAIRGTLSRLGGRGGGQGTTTLESLCTALAGTVGTGNIAGVAVALTMGGPGAIFWMWVSAFLGMGLKYAEIALAVKYRESRGGEYVGGPMYTIKNALPRSFYPLAVVFSLGGAVCSFGLGNMMQTGSVLTLLPSLPLPPAVLGAALGLLVLLSCRGGAAGRGRTASLLVPLMALLYVLSCLGVIFVNFHRLSGAVLSIFKGALGLRPVAGGTAGAALSWGLRRGLFSNEAGMGSSPIAHASACAGSPSQQGLTGIFEVFADTLVLCTLTALAVLCSGVETGPGAPEGAGLVCAALSTVYGQTASTVFLGVSMALFAFSSIVGWSLYGERCVEFLAGEGSVPVYRAAFASVTFLSCLLPFPAILELSDTAAFFMMVPNLVSLCLLAARGKVDLQP